MSGYSYKPQPKDIREQKLSEIRRQTPVGTISIPRIPALNGVNRLDTYRIPLDYLVYNPHNKRFATRAKTLAKRLPNEGHLDADNPEHIEHIKKFLWEYKKTKNEDTIRSLINNGQLEPGIVTSDGVILAGNRRFRLLNEIAEKPEQYPEAKTNEVRFFEAAIVDRVLDRKEIIRFESFFQYGIDEKVDYGPIEKYLAIAEQAEEGFTDEEIYENFQAIADSKSKIKEWRETFPLMREYLKYIGEPEIYTALYNYVDDRDTSKKDSREEHFINLRSQLSTLKRKSSKGSWDYTERDIADFRVVFFDYIHAYVTVEAIRKLSGIFKRGKSVWQGFFETHKKRMMQDSIEPMDGYRNKYPNLAEEELSIRRANDFQDTFRKDMKTNLGNYEGMRRALDEEEQRRTAPVEILKKVSAALDQFKDAIKKVQKSSDAYNQVVELLNDIRKKVGQLKQDLD